MSASRKILSLSEQANAHDLVENRLEVLCVIEALDGYSRGEQVGAL